MTDFVYLPREIEGAVCDATRSMPVTVLTGLRQTGKSTLLQNEPSLAGRRYVTLDDFPQLMAAQSDPDAFVSSDQPLTIDEAQRAPELLLAIKRAVDKRRRPGAFVLSGSANIELLAQVAESLAGRAVTLHLRPLSRRELETPRARKRRNRAGSEPFVVSFAKEPRAPTGDAIPLTDAEILRGGLPPVTVGGAPSALWFRGYEQTYLERDVRALARLGDLTSFRTLLRLAALRTGSLLNLSELARDARMSATTAGRYLSLMEASFVLWRLPPFLANRASRLVKSPKLYVGDAGLAAHLAGVTDLAVDEPLRGTLLETYVYHALASALEAHAPDARLSFWNVQGRYEVDFVVELDRKSVLAIEVKAGSRWSERDLRSLRAFLDATPSCRAAILAHNGASSVKLGDRLWAVALGALLS